MKAFILAACVASSPCIADDGIPWMTPHVVDTGVSIAILQSSPGAFEVNPLGFPGVVVAKFALEGIALGYRDAGDVETCQAVAGGAPLRRLDRRRGYTMGGLVAGPVGLALGGLGAGLLSWQWSQDSAQWTCSQLHPLADYAPYSYSGAECMGWNDARQDFCNDWSYR